METGTPASPTLVYSELDNPNIHFKELLQYVPAQSGTVTSPQEVFGNLAPYDFKFSKSDFLVEATGGADPANADGTSGAVGSVNDLLYPWPNQAGYWAPVPITADGDVPFDTHAVRLGHTPLTITLVQKLPDMTRRLGALAFDVQLDPSVALVPVEVIVPYTAHYPQTDRRLAFQKVLWDLGSEPTENSEIDIPTSSGSELSTVARSWTPPKKPNENWNPNITVWPNRDKTGHYNYSEVYTPDSVWDRCGIQFRMVHYVEFEAPDDSYVVAQQGTCDTFGDNEPMHRAEGYANAHNLEMPGVPIRVVFMQTCNCPQAIGIDDEGDGRFNGGLVCVGRDAKPFVLSHELGHALGLCEAYTGTLIPGQCTVGNCPPGYSLMCANPGDPGSKECSTAYPAAMNRSNDEGW